MAYSHDVPVANPAPFINSATGEPMEWFAVNDYDDYYYYDAYYYDFYGSDEPQVGWPRKRMKFEARKLKFCTKGLMELHEAPEAKKNLETLTAGDLVIRKWYNYEFFKSVIFYP